MQSKLPSHCTITLDLNSLHSLNEWLQSTRICDSAVEKKYAYLKGNLGAERGDRDGFSDGLLE